MRKPNTAKAAPAAQDLRQRAARARDAAGRFIKPALQVDPIFEAIAASRRAEAEMQAFERKPRPWGITAAERTEENALADLQTVARATVFGIVPTTGEGRRALVEYIRFQGELCWGANWRARVLTDEFGEMFLSLLAVVEAGLPDVPDNPSKAIMKGWAAWGATLGACNDEGKGTLEYERACKHRDNLLDAAEALPATPENIAAKAIARLWMDWVEDERPGQPRETFSFGGKLAFDVNTAIMGRAASRTASPEAQPAPSHQAGPSPDLRDASIQQLARLYDHVSSIAFIASTACNAPMAWDDQRRNHNSVGHLLHAEHCRLDELAERVVEEITGRRPADAIDREDRLSTIVKRQMEVFSAIDDPEIAAEINAAWGA